MVAGCCWRPSDAVLMRGLCVYTGDDGGLCAVSLSGRGDRAQLQRLQLRPDCPDTGQQRPCEHIDDASHPDSLVVLATGTGPRVPSGGVT